MSKEKHQTSTRYERTIARQLLQYHTRMLSVIYRYIRLVTNLTLEDISPMS